MRFLCDLDCDGYHLARSDCDRGHLSCYRLEIVRQTARCWWGVKTSFALMAGRGSGASSFVAFVERVAMRNALGLMLASVVAAVVIAGIWFWTSSPRVDAAPPKTVAARPAEPLPA